MTPQIFFPALGPLGSLVAALFAVAMVILHVALAVSVSQDTGRLRSQNRAVVVLSPFAWTLAALVLGLAAVALYWICHYSRFGRKELVPPTGPVV